MEKNKVIRVLSTTAMTSLMTLALGSTAYAKTTDILTKDSTTGKLAQYSYEDLKNSLMGDKVLFNEFKTKTVQAYKDDKAGYVDFSYLTNQYMSIGKANFVLDTVTAATPVANVIVPTDAITPRVVNQDGTIKDGTVIHNVQTVTTVTVDAVSVEEGKTATPVVTVKDQDGNAMTSGYALSYAITAGTSSVNATTGVVTGATYSATAANNVNTLTVTATPTTGTAITGTATATVTADVTKPTIASVTAINAQQFKVVYSESVDATDAIALGNYSLYSGASGATYTLNAAAGAGQIKSTAKLQADGKTVLITIVNTKSSDPYTVGGDQSGFAMNGFTNSNYILYVNGVHDSASTPNAIVANSNTQFTGTTAANTVAPTLLAASYNTGTAKLALSFDNVPTSVDLTKTSIVNGTGSVVLTGASQTVSGLTVTITLTAAQATAVGALGQGINAQLAIGGVTDGTNSNAFAESALVNTTLIPQVAASSYDESTNKLTVNLNQAVKTSNIDVTGLKLQYSTDGTTFSDLTTLNTTDYTVSPLGTSASTFVYTLDQTAIDAISAQRATANVTYRIGVNTNANVLQTPGLVWNNISVAGFQYAAVTYTKETVAPSITAVKFYTTASASTPRFTGDTAGVAANHLYITLDQSIRAASVTNDGKLVLSYGSTPTVVSLTATAGNVTVATLLADGKTLDVAFAGGAETASIAAGTATVQMLASSTLSDVNGNKVAAATAPAIVYSNNTTSGSLTATQLSSRQIKLQPAAGVYSDASIAAATFQVYQTTNINNQFAVTKAEGIDTDGDGIKDKLYITLSSSTPLAVDGASAGYYTVKWSGLKDQNGVTIADGTAAFAKLAANDSAAPTIVQAKTVLADSDSNSTVSAGDVVTLFFNEPVVLPVNAQLNTTTWGTGATAAYGDSSNIIKITLGSTPGLTLGASGTALTTANVYVAGPDATKEILDVVGTSYAQGAGTDYVNYPALQGTAPTISSSVYSDTNADGIFNTGDKIVVTFNQPITANAAAVATPTLLNDDFLLTGHNTTFSNVAISGSTATLTIGTVGTGVFGDTVRMHGTPGNVNTTNSWGVKTADTTGKVMTSSDTTAPTILSATYSDLGTPGNSNKDLITVKFSEPINVGTVAANMGDFVFVTNTGVLADGSTPYQVASDTIAFVVTDATNLDLTAGTTQIRLGSASSATLKDASNNPVVRTAGVTITAATQDIVAPAAAVLANLTIGTTSFTGASLEAGSTVKVVANGGVASDAAVVSAAVAVNGTVSVTPLVSGTSYEVFVIDPSGNASAGLHITMN